jgi:hypothetical protein
MIALHDEWQRRSASGSVAAAARADRVSLRHDAWRICRALISERRIFRPTGVAPLSASLPTRGTRSSRLVERSEQSELETTRRHCSNPAIRAAIVRRVDRQEILRRFSRHTSSIRRCSSCSLMSSVCVASIQRWPNGTQPAPRGTGRRRG